MQAPSTFSLQTMMKYLNHASHSCLGLTQYATFTVFVVAFFFRLLLGFRLCRVRELSVPRVPSIVDAIFSLGRWLINSQDW